MQMKGSFNARLSRCVPNQWMNLKYDCAILQLDNVLTVKHLKFVISQAYSHFVSVHDVEVEGKTAT